MAGSEFHYKEWRVEVLHKGQGWKALIYRPHSLLHETEVPEGSGTRMVTEKAMRLIDKLLAQS